MKITQEWFDEPGAATEPTAEVAVTLVGQGADGVLKKKSTVARLRYVGEKDMILAKTAARMWLAKNAPGLQQAFVLDLLLQVERPFILAAGLADAEDAAVNFFMSRGGQQPGEVAMEHLVYREAQRLLEAWEAFIDQEFPLIPTPAQQEGTTEEAGK